MWPEGFDLSNTYERFQKCLTLRKVLPTFIQSGLNVFYVLATELGARDRVLGENRHDSCYQIIVETSINRKTTQIKVKSHLRYPA